SEVIVQADWIDDADACKRESLLTLQKWDLFGQAEMQRMRRTLKKAAIEQTRDVVGAHRAICNASLRRRYFDERLEPLQSAGAVADEVNRRIAPLCLLGDCLRDALGADRQRGSIARHVDCRPHVRVFSSIKASNFSGVTRP